MKTIITALFHLLLYSTLSAQAFGTQGTWHFEFREFGYQYLYEVGYEKDSIINGTTYQALGATGLQYLRTGLNSSQTFPAPKRYFFLRTQNDTVYRLDTNGNDYILYDFNAQVGDSWVIGPADTLLMCSGIPTVQVQATGTDTLNGKALKYWQVSSGGSQSHLIFPTGVIYEQIGFVGSMGMDLMFEPTWQNCDTNVVVDPARLFMRCYQHSEVGFINRMPRGNNCDSVEALGLLSEPIESIGVYPNPTSGTFKVKSTKQSIKQFSLRNAQGGLMESRALSLTKSLTISKKLAPGIYFLVLELESQKMATARVVIQ